MVMSVAPIRATVPAPKPRNTSPMPQKAKLMINKAHQKDEHNLGNQIARAGAKALKHLEFPGFGKAGG